jgi:hypothetical protein
MLNLTLTNSQIVELVKQLPQKQFTEEVLHEKD